MHLQSSPPSEETTHTADRFGEDAFVSVLRQAASEPVSTELWRRAVAQIVVATTSHAVRNAAALTLADLAGTEFADALIEVIRRPDLAGHIGTLIYALDELGASLPLDVLIQVIGQGSYEATAEALLFVNDDRIIVSGDAAHVADLRTKLHEFVTSADPNIGEAARDTLSYLDRRL